MIKAINVAKLLLALERIRDSGVSENSDSNRHCRHCNRFQNVAELPVDMQVRHGGHVNPHDEQVSKQFPSLVPVCVTANEALIAYRASVESKLK
jgi:hypothetical protein